MLTQDQKDRLTPEELIIAEKWELEKEQGDILYNEMQAALKENNQDALVAFAQKLGDLAPSNCEHGKSIWTGCMSCDDLELKLYPESFAKCKVCQELSNKEDMENGCCINCPKE